MISTSSTTRRSTATPSLLVTADTLRFDDGAVQFRQRLTVSILSCKPLFLRNIRSDDVESPGLRPYEVSYLRLLTSLTNGTHIEINNTGTQVRFHPGVLVGGEIVHDCPPPPDTTSNSTTSTTAGDDQDDPLWLSRHTRAVGWFLEGILPLAPFGKEPLILTLNGITDGTCEWDPTVDYLKATVLPLLQQFGIGTPDPTDHGLFAPQAPSLTVQRRGAAPGGGGQIRFHCPTVPKELRAIDWMDSGLIKRVRGTAITTRIVSTSLAARTAYAAKGLLHRLLPDVWIHTDAHSIKQHRCGPSPSLSLILVAESTTGTVLATECCRQSSSTGPPELPEELGTRGAARLLEEIRRGGCVDTGMQSLALLFMCLTPEDVSRIRLGTLTEYTIVTLRLLRQALGVEFKIKADAETQTVVLSCLGTGYRNMARAST